jgi:hypothetical protein
LIFASQAKEGGDMTEKIVLLLVISVSEEADRERNAGGSPGNKKKNERTS